MGAHHPLYTPQGCGTIHLSDLTSEYVVSRPARQASYLTLMLGMPNAPDTALWRAGWTGKAGHRPVLPASAGQVAKCRDLTCKAVCRAKQWSKHASGLPTDTATSGLELNANVSRIGATSDAQECLHACKCRPGGQVHVEFHVKATAQW